MQQHLFSAWRGIHAGTLGVAAAAVLLLGCSRGDVGAPCNHGDIDPPDSQVVTFPALSCDQLLCVYGDDQDPPDGNCDDNDDCNSVRPELERFECVNNTCRLNSTYVLERSMCSKKCSSDADCANGGVGNRVVVDDTKCQSGFKCTIVQELGTFCCQKLCVCNDDLPSPDAELIDQCENSTAPGCCVERDGEDNDNFVPGEGCG